MSKVKCRLSLVACHLSLVACRLLIRKKKRFNDLTTEQKKHLNDSTPKRLNKKNSIFV